MTLLFMVGLSSVGGSDLFLQSTFERSTQHDPPGGLNHGQPRQTTRFLNSRLK